ncbi:MAG: guanylate kinase [Proteobacteria bacterium]|nr:guanylate kinase [Pseudomonadota bacterium]
MKKICPMLMTVTGPSGTGKDAVINALVEQDPQVTRFVTATTRTPRPGEMDGVHYYFLTHKEFEKRLAEGGFYEHNPGYHTNYYGTLKSVVDAHFAEGQDVISDINIDGVRAFEKTLPERLFKILILPPSRERLVQRLTQRNPELAEEGGKRLAAAEADLDHLHDPNWVFQNPDMCSSADGRGSSYKDYDVVLINDVLDHTVAELARIVAAERARREG